MASDRGVGWAVVLLAVVGGFVGGVLAFKFLFPQAMPLQASPRVVQSNAETWQWTDWKGRERSITVHREVKESV